MPPEDRSSAVISAGRAIGCVDSSFCLVSSVDLPRPPESTLPHSYQIMSTTRSSEVGSDKKTYLSIFSDGTPPPGLNKISLQSSFCFDKRTFTVTSQVRRNAQRDGLVS